jgi:hypothetical protein
MVAFKERTARIGIHPRNCGLPCSAWIIGDIMPTSHSKSCRTETTVRVVGLFVLFFAGVAGLPTVGVTVQPASTPSAAVQRLKEDYARSEERAKKRMLPQHSIFESSGKNGCDISITVVSDAYVYTDNSDPSGPKTVNVPEEESRTRVPLAEIDPTDIGTDGSHNVTFHTTNYVETIPTGSSDPKISNISHSDLAALEWIDQEEENAFRADFKRAAELCGGRKSSSPLPDVVVEFEVTPAASAPVGDEFIRHHYLLTPKYKYHLCKELSRDVKLDGYSFFQRWANLNDAVWYFTETIPDVVFKKTSTSSAQIKILEVEDVKSAKCPPHDEAFSNIEELGPSNGWSKMRGYHEVDNKSGSSMREGLLISVDAEPASDEVYCTHRLVIESTIGDVSYSLDYWDAKHMVVLLTARQHLFDEGPHIAATLWVKYVHEGHKANAGCTEPPPRNWNERHSVPLQRKLPDGSVQFETAGP